MTSKCLCTLYLIVLTVPLVKRHAAGQRDGCSNHQISAVIMVDFSDNGEAAVVQWSSGRCPLNLSNLLNRPPLGGRQWLTQVSSTALDHGSKLRIPSPKALL
ncbi:hypothetical protein TNCV_402231 [Trichonephila clavipes]|nr:hypothetical protein TNCV_402231 [Trichonephila clavipes]